MRMLRTQTMIYIIIPSKTRRGLISGIDIKLIIFVVIYMGPHTRVQSTLF